MVYTGLLSRQGLPVPAPLPDKNGGTVQHLVGSLQPFSLLPWALGSSTHDNPVPECGGDDFADAFGASAERAVPVALAQ